MSQSTFPPHPHSYSRHTGLPATLSPNLVMRLLNSLGLHITSTLPPNSYPLHFLMAIHLPWGLWGIRAPSRGYYQDRAGRELHFTESEVEIKLGAHFSHPAGFRRMLCMLAVPSSAAASSSSLIFSHCHFHLPHLDSCGWPSWPSAQPQSKPCPFLSHPSLPTPPSVTAGEAEVTKPGVKTGA